MGYIYIYLITKKEYSTVQLTRTETVVLSDLSTTLVIAASRRCSLIVSIKVDYQKSKPTA